MNSLFMLVFLFFFPLILFIDIRVSASELMMFIVFDVAFLYLDLTVSINSLLYFSRSILYMLIVLSALMIILSSCISLLSEHFRLFWYFEHTLLNVMFLHKSKTLFSKDISLVEMGPDILEEKMLLYQLLLSTSCSSLMLLFPCFFHVNTLLNLFYLQIYWSF